MRADKESDTLAQADGERDPAAFSAETEATVEQTASGNHQQLPVQAISAEI